MVEALLEENEVIGPKSRDRDTEGNKIYRFLKINSFEELEKAVIDDLIRTEKNEH